MKKILFITFIMIILTANIAFGISIVDVACGLNHTVLLAEDGTVWTMGDNSEGQCGQPEKGSIREPKQIKHIPKIIQVGAAGNMTMLLDENGNSYLIGDNQRMRLFATDCTDIAIASIPELAEKYAEHNHHIYFPYFYAVAKEDGNVYVAGNDENENLGLRENLGSIAYTHGYADISNVVDVSWTLGYHSESSFYSNTVAEEYKNTFYLKCINSEGEQYRVKIVYSTSAFRASLALEEVTVADGDIFETTTIKMDPDYEYSTIKLTDAGTVYLNDTILYELYGEKIVKAGVGISHYIFVGDDGKVYGMGANDYGQLGVKSKDEDEKVEIVGISSMVVGEDWGSTSYSMMSGLIKLGNIVRFITIEDKVKSDGYMWTDYDENEFDLSQYMKGKKNNNKYYTIPTLIESLQEIVPSGQSSLAYMTSDARVWIGGIVNFSLMFEVGEDMTLRNTGNNLQDIFTNGALNIKVYDWNKVNGQDVQITSAQGLVYNVYENGVNITQTITPNFVFKRGKVYQLECGIGGADVFVERGKTYTIKFEGMNASKVKDGVVTQMRSTVDIAKFVLRVYVTELANLT